MPVASTDTPMLCESSSRVLAIFLKSLQTSINTLSLPTTPIIVLRRAMVSVMVALTYLSRMRPHSCREVDSSSKVVFANDLTRVALSVCTQGNSENKEGESNSCEVVGHEDEDVMGMRT